MPRPKGSTPWNKGLTKSDPRVAKYSRSGWKHSEATKKIMRQKKIGHTPWNKGLTKNDPRVERYASKIRGIPKSEDVIKKISKAKKGRTPYNKGLTKETSEIVRRYSTNGSKTILRQFINGRKIWCEGQTKENNAVLKIIGIKSSKARLEEIRTGKRDMEYIRSFQPETIWNKGLTKETHPSMKLISEARVRYMQENDGVHISEREKRFHKWFLELGLGDYFIAQYRVGGISNPYNTDFYFPKLNLIIEFDGDYYHWRKKDDEGRIRYDTDIIRTRELRAQGYVVLRFIETKRKMQEIEDEFAKEQITKVITYLLEDKNGRT